MVQKLGWLGSQPAGTLFRMSRRDVLKLLGSAAWLTACGSSGAAPARTQPTSMARPENVRAIGFDLFTLFDPRGVDRRVQELLPAGADVKPRFAATWKSRLFQYSWIRTASGQYADFEQLVRDALDYASRVHDLKLSASARRRLEASFTELEPWPDTLDVLGELHSRGLRLAPLANFSPRMIEALLEHGEVRHFFHNIISTDRARTYKPDPRAYALGEEVFGLPRSQIAFSAFGGWDAAGARWFGFPTFWVNRLSAPLEELEPPHATGPDLRHLALWLAGEQK